MIYEACSKATSLRMSRKSIPRFYSFHHFRDLKQTFKIFLISFSHFTIEEEKPRNAKGLFQAMEEVSGRTGARTHL